MNDNRIIDGYMQDSMGRLVPENMVPEIDKLRNELVHRLANEARALQQQMRDFKARALGEIAAFVELSASEYDVRLGGRKGNLHLTAYDGREKIQVQISESLQFDERIQAAKELIDQCLTDWTKSGAEEIKTIVYDAFNVDKEGKINTRRILGLRKYDIRDERWLKAMGIIYDSLEIVGSKQYFRLYERASADEKFRAISLDMAGL